MSRSHAATRNFPVGVPARLARRLAHLLRRRGLRVTRHAPATPRRRRAELERLHRLADEIRWFTPR